MVEDSKCDKDSEKLGKAVVHTYIENLVRAGILDVVGKSNKEIVVFILVIIFKHTQI